MSFVSELRRRQVFRAAAWYGGIAWLAVEVADTVFPRFGLPDWSVRAVIVAAVLGLPVALILAWSLDLSAGGLRRESESAGRQGTCAARVARAYLAHPFAVGRASTRRRTRGERAASLGPSHTPGVR